MPTDAELQQAAASANQHADNLHADIKNAQTRVEHMRLTTLAIEARHLANVLTQLAARPDLTREQLDANRD